MRIFAVSLVFDIRVRRVVHPKLSISVTSTLLVGHAPIPPQVSHVLARDFPARCSALVAPVHGGPHQRGGVERRHRVRVDVRARPVLVDAPAAVRRVRERPEGALGVHRREELFIGKSRRSSDTASNFFISSTPKLRPERGGGAPHALPSDRRTVALPASVSTRRCFAGGASGRPRTAGSVESGTLVSLRDGGRSGTPRGDGARGAAGGAGAGGGAAGAATQELRVGPRSSTVGAVGAGGAGAGAVAAGSATRTSPRSVARSDGVSEAGASPFVIHEGSVLPRPRPPGPGDARSGACGVAAAAGISLRTARRALKPPLGVEDGGGAGLKPPRGGGGGAAQPAAPRLDGGEAARGGAGVKPPCGGAGAAAQPVGVCAGPPLLDGEVARGGAGVKPPWGGGAAQPVAAGAGGEPQPPVGVCAGGEPQPPVVCPGGEPQPGAVAAPAAGFHGGAIGKD